MATAIHQYEDKLLDFAYGELPAPEASAVESHVKSCPRCSAALAQIKGVRTSMAALPQLAAPDAGLDSLLAYAEQAAARNAAAPRPGLAPWWRRFVAPLAGACALALVVVVAVQTNEEGGLDLSKESAMKAAKTEAQLDERRPPAPVVAAPPPPPSAQNEMAELARNKGDEGGQFAANDKLGNAAKPAKAAKVAQPGKGGWDPAPTRADNNYEQALGTTAAPSVEEDRQLAQKQELGEALKQSKTRRESPSADYGNARGGYVQDKEAKEVTKKKAIATKDAVPSAPPSPQAAQPAPAPTKAPAQAMNEPAERPADEAKAAPAPKQQASSGSKPSIGFGLSNSGAGSSSSGPTGGSGSAALGTRAQTRDSSDDDTAAIGADQLADRKRNYDDASGQQREREAEARPHLEAARSASMQSNHQEEVKQSLYALQTGVRGAPRAEALSRLCNALIELGNEGQADQYCNALLKEFPNTAAAKVVANKRKELQRASTKPAPSSKKSPSADEVYEKAEPAVPKQPESKPASAY